MSRTFLVTVASCLALTGALLVAGQRQAGPAAPTETLARFVDVASIAGVTFQHVNGASPERHLHEIMSGGGLFLDFDNDGWLDVFLVDGGSLTDPAMAGPHGIVSTAIAATARSRTQRLRPGCAHRLRHGRVRGRRQQRRVDRSLHHERWPERAVSEQRRQGLHRCHEGVGGGWGAAVQRELRLRRRRSRRRRRPVRRQLRGRAARQQHLLRRCAEADAHLLSPAELQAALERAVPEQRQRHFHRRQRRLRNRLPPRKRTWRGAGRLRR